MAKLSSIIFFRVFTIICVGLGPKCFSLAGFDLSYSRGLSPALANSWLVGGRVRAAHASLESDARLLCWREEQFELETNSHPLRVEGLAAGARPAGWLLAADRWR